MSTDSGLPFLEKLNGVTTASSDGSKGSLLAISSSSHCGVARLRAVGLGIWSEFGEDAGGVGLIGELLGEAGVLIISGVLDVAGIINCAISGNFTLGSLFSVLSMSQTTSSVSIPRIPNVAKQFKNSITIEKETGVH